MSVVKLLRLHNWAIVLATLVLITAAAQFAHAGRYDTAHLSITAQALSDEYNRNEIAADERFKDRQINVGGIIHTIGRDEGGVIH